MQVVADLFEISGYLFTHTAEQSTAAIITTKHQGCQQRGGNRRCTKYCRGWDGSWGIWKLRDHAKKSAGLSRASGNPLCRDLKILLILSSACETIRCRPRRNMGFPSPLAASGVSLCVHPLVLFRRSKKFHIITRTQSLCNNSS